MPQYCLAYDPDRCEWIATTDARMYTAETEPQARLWLARQLAADETDEERAWLERARAWAGEEEGAR